jgi:DNA-binding transcriptional regulator YhcF (GntR family)
MSSQAPYQQIVRALRGQIERGELRPGDRVPSTRQITRDWCVAMATATKVIATLRDEGLVDTHPGSGTVVRSPSPPPTAPARREHDLTRDRIVAAAITLADADGLATLSMRRVASELGTVTASLYRHVPGKDALVQQMTNTVFAGPAFPPLPLSRWKERLAAIARITWTIVRRHPWTAGAISLIRPQALPNLMIYAEYSLATLRYLGFDADDMMYCNLHLFGHVRGMGLILESEAQARQDTGLTSDEWIEAQESGLAAVMSSGRFPALAYLDTQPFTLDLDAMFEYGLGLLLEGVGSKARGR